MPINQKLLTEIIFNLNRLTSSAQNKKFNFFAFILLCMPLIFSLAHVLFNDRLDFSNYGNVFKDFMCILFYTVVHPTFTILFVLLCCSLSHHCLSVIENLTQNILKNSPYWSDPTTQFDILKTKAVVDDALKNIQKAFSLLYLFIIISNLLSCGIVIAWFLSSSFENFIFFMLIQPVIIAVNCYTC